MCRDASSPITARSRWLSNPPAGSGLRWACWIGGALGALFGLGVALQEYDPLAVVPVPLIMGGLTACISAKLYLFGRDIVGMIRGLR
jgi:hypothetical protein